MRPNSLPFTGTMVVTAMLVACQGEPPPDSPDAPSTVAVEDGRPNILFILTDDLGYTDVGSFGGEISTPNLDALAFEGVRLTNFHAAPYCAATRASLMSGMTTREAGVIFHNETLRPDVATMPEWLGAAGYHTYMSGKWNLGITLEQSARARGFELSFALGPPADNHLGHSNYPPVSEFAPGGAYLENGVSFPLPEEWFSSDLFTDKLIEQISTNLNDGVPWFGYLALTAPHWPLQAPEDWIDRTRPLRRRLRCGAGGARRSCDGARRASGWIDWMDTRGKRLRGTTSARNTGPSFHGNLFGHGRERRLEHRPACVPGGIRTTRRHGSSHRTTARPEAMIRSIRPRCPARTTTFRWPTWAGNGRLQPERGWGEATAPFRELKGSMYTGGTQVATFVRHPD